MAGLLFDDIFRVRKLDPDGKKFERVSRVHCESESHGMHLILDFNSLLYPLKVKQKFRMMLATTLHEDGTLETEFYNPKDPLGVKADGFEYVMHGKVYRIEEIGVKGRFARTLAVYVSFGGLLMRMAGNLKNISAFQCEMNLYLLMKKLSY